MGSCLQKGLIQVQKREYEGSKWDIENNYEIIAENTTQIIAFMEVILVNIGFSGIWAQIECILDILFNLAA